MEGIAMEGIVEPMSRLTIELILGYISKIDEKKVFGCNGLMKT